MNKKDMLIVTCLRNNARESLTNMSKKLKIPVSTIYERLRQNGGGLIKKHTSLIDFNELGYSLRANIMLKVNRSCREEIKEYLLKHFQVNSLYRINNGFDYLCEGVFRHLKEFEEFLEKVEEKFTIEKVDVHYVIDDLKRESFMSDLQLLEI
ncbi:MAG: Lrp/AsnC family transcriptional regulator [Nanobdellota archaeon]